MSAFEAQTPDEGRLVLASPRLGARDDRIAAACGVTRIADITGLDSIGVPVYQAVRPLSRALCVHQGKGLTRAAARTGALMEALESHRAETFSAPQWTASYAALPDGERAACLADFSGDGARMPKESEPLAWVEARRMDGRGRLWVPFEVVSLDFTRRGDCRLDRSSTGLGAGYSLEWAIAKALLEVIERDADRAWRTAPLYRRSLDRIELGSIPYDWFGDMRARITASGVTCSVYLEPSPAKLPVVLAELIEPGAGCCSRRAVYGVACHVQPEAALLGALLEAIQSRLTAIAGVRDDVPFPTMADPNPSNVGFGFPLPPGILPKDWRAETQNYDASPQVQSSALAERLARAGYPDAAIIDLSPPGGEAFVVKAVVPGLGGLDRNRRVAATRT